MASVDGELSDAEFTLLKTIAKRSHLTENELAAIRKSMAPIAFEIPKNDPRNL